MIDSADIEMCAYAMLYCCMQSHRRLLTCVPYRTGLCGTSLRAKANHYTVASRQGTEEDQRRATAVLAAPVDTISRVRQGQLICGKQTHVLFASGCLVNFNSAKLFGPNCASSGYLLWYTTHCWIS
eukprot:jgi/Ulvmu1/9945/UM058_0028.1